MLPTRTGTRIFQKLSLFHRKERMMMYSYDGYRRLVSKVLRIKESTVLPLQEDDLMIIGRMMEAIGNRYKRILSRRFGLIGGQKQTLKEVAKEFELSPERIRQTEELALNKLRHPSRIVYFLGFTKAGIEQQKRIVETPLLKKRIEDFELSTRTLNGVKSAGVRTIVELAAKTEVEMLKIKNFGRKSLFELKSLLLSLGLDFARDERHRR